MFFRRKKPKPEEPTLISERDSDYVESVYVVKVREYYEI